MKITKGYSSLREVSVVKDGEDPVVYSVRCGVFADGMGKPVYECDFKLQSNGQLTDMFVKRAETPTTAMRNGLKELGALGGKKWNGFDFFGLKMEAVQKKISKEATPEPADMAPEEQAALKAVSNSPEFSRKEVKWVRFVLNDKVYDGFGTGFLSFSFAGKLTEAQTKLNLDILL